MATSLRGYFSVGAVTGSDSFLVILFLTVTVVGVVPSASAEEEGNKLNESLELRETMLEQLEELEELRDSLSETTDDRHLWRASFRHHLPLRLSWTVR